jgi:hypothetical protein
MKPRDFSNLTVSDFVAIKELGDVVTITKTLDQLQVNVPVDVSAGPIAVTIKSAAIQDRTVFLFRHVGGDLSLNNCTIETEGAETIKGETNAVFRTNGIIQEFYVYGGNLV